MTKTASRTRTTRHLRGSTRKTPGLKVRALKQIGFEGFHAIQELWDGGADGIPRSPGVYVVIRSERSSPRFRRLNPAFRHKGRDPTEPRRALMTRWVRAADVIYIGKAGKRGGKATLWGRIRNYLRSGRGLSSAHWGGRAIWHLTGAKKLTIAWLKTPAQQARTKEKSLIAEFRRAHGTLPFANRTS
jgi:hypothetical protein